MTKVSAIEHAVTRYVELTILGLLMKEPGTLAKLLEDKELMAKYKQAKRGHYSAKYRPAKPTAAKYPIQCWVVVKE